MLFKGSAIVINVILITIVKSNEICSDCWHNNLANVCNYLHCNVTSYCENKVDLNMFTKLSTGPQLLCKERTSLTFLWENMTDMHYFMQYSLSDSNKYQLSNTTSRCNHLTVPNLYPNQKYDAYFYAYSIKEYKLFKTAKVTIKTLDKLENRIPVKSLNYTLSLSENGYEANVFWTPGPDLACYYEIMWYGENRHDVYFRDEINLKYRPENKYKLLNLKFGKRYRFRISSLSGSETSQRFEEIKIVVPSCLDTFKNLSICVPRKPKKFTLTELPITPSYNMTSDDPILTFKLNWQRPELLPDFYELNITSPDKYNNNSVFVKAKIPGDKTSWIFENIPVHSSLKAEIIAYSKAGPSASVCIEYILSNLQNMTYTSNSWMWISACIALVIKLLFLLVFRQRIVFCVSSICLDKKKYDSNIVKYTATHATDPKWELAESKLLIDKVIGFGAFGIVQKGYYYLEADRKIVVAVKTLKAKSNEDQITQFYDEIEIMKSVPYHAHIVYLIGVVTKNRPCNPLMLVEYCAGGNLQSYLRKVALVVVDSFDENATKISEEGASQVSNKAYDLYPFKANGDVHLLKPSDLLSFARQIVLGMEFLSNLKVIHRDLAARNVLITEDNTLKISDFGLSRDIYTDNIYKKLTGGKLPFRWMALESLTHQIYTTESDVWSFGIVLWEIVTLGCDPYPTVNTEDLIKLLKSGYRMEKPTNCYEELYQVMLSCWLESPNLRPSFKELRETFDQLLESNMQYVRLDNCLRLSNSNLYKNVVNKV